MSITKPAPSKPKLTTLSLDPSMYGSKHTNYGRVDPSVRHSIASSDTSSVDLHRTSSTSSHNSTSTASSTASVNHHQRPQHRKTFSGTSIHVPRRLFKKNRPQDLQRQNNAEVAVKPVIQPAPAVPSVPAAPSPPAVATPSISTQAIDWQCSDLVVRCKNDVYHVDRVIMCYHSRWFAKVCAVLMAPVSCML